MAKKLSVEELLERAKEEVAREFPNSDPAEVLVAILRAQVRARPGERA